MPSIQRVSKRPAPLMTPRRMETRDRVCKMLALEATARSSDDYTSLTRKSSLPCHNQAWREQVAQWFYDLVDHLDLTREIVFVAMDILDRFVASSSTTTTCQAESMDKTEYERSAITSFFLATRISNSRKIKITELLSLSASSLNPRDVLMTGTRILESLSWDHQIVTPRSFVKAFLGLLPSTVDRRTLMSWFEFSVYLVELSVCDGNFSHVPASQIAFASIIVAMKEAQGFTVDKAMFGRFVKTILQDTGINVASAQLQSVCVRLQNSYCQSQESCNTDFPHIVQDDDDDEEEEEELKELSDEGMHPFTDVNVQTPQGAIPRPISPSPDLGL